MHAAFRENPFEQVGDVLTLMPAFVGVVVLAIEDYRGFGELALGTLISQTTVEILKRSFDYAHSRGYNVSFAKRPCCEDYKGFPSGHSAGGFSAASFVYYRYGLKPALPIIALAIVTAASRVQARKHSFWQVLAGGVISWSYGWLFTSKYKPKRFWIAPELGSDYLGGMRYGFSISYKF